MLEKCRRHRVGELEPYYRPTLGQGFDRMLAEHLGIPFRRFLSLEREAAVAKRSLDCALEEFLPDELDVVVWNRRLVQRGLRGYGKYRLERRKQQLGLGDCPGLKTMGDLIEYLEGRLPRAAW